MTHDDRLLSLFLLFFKGKQRMTRLAVQVMKSGIINSCRSVFHPPHHFQDCILILWREWLSSQEATIYDEGIRKGGSSPPRFFKLQSKLQVMLCLSSCALSLFKCWARIKLWWHKLLLVLVLSLSLSLIAFRWRSLHAMASQEPSAASICAPKDAVYGFPEIRLIKSTWTCLIPKGKQARISLENRGKS